MSFNALLVSGDTNSVRVLCAALEELKIEQETCRSVPDALELLAVEPYSALLIDFDLPGAAHVVRMARMAPPQRRPVVFALLSLHADVIDTFQCGANFVLNKPADVNQIFRSLRAGRAFMRRDRRRAARHKTEALVYLRFGDLCPMPAVVLDLNERGLAIQAAEPLPPSRIPLRFILPGTEFLIEGRGDVIWADDGGRAGILFTEMPPSSKRQLKQWVTKRDKRKPVNSSAPRTSKSRPHSAHLS